MSLAQNVMRLLNDANNDAYRVFCVDEYSYNNLINCAYELERNAKRQMCDDVESTKAALKTVRLFARVMQDAMLDDALAFCEAQIAFALNCDLTIAQCAIVARIDTKSMRNVLSQSKIERFRAKDDARTVYVKAKSLRAYLDSRTRVYRTMRRKVVESVMTL